MSKNASKHNDTQAPIAIVGMGCLFPRAAGLKDYWRLLHRSEDAVTDVPESHWRVDDYFDADPASSDRTYCRRGAFLSPVDFDPLEFGIVPTALEATDTSQLLSLIVAKAALADAGYGPEREYDRQRAGVILGVTGLQELSLPLNSRLEWPVWDRALREAGVDPELAADVMERLSDSYVEWQESSFPGLLGNVVAGRIANRLNLQGTNCVVDAACASSLSAMHLAILELSAGRADVMLSGGVDALNDIFMYLCFSKTQALSASGDARPFSKDADGTVLGEGMGMVVLKRLDDARRDGDRIYAVIRGIGTSSDGRSESIYAPLAAGQARALREAYRVSGVNPGTVQFVEAHGTGTKVGDVVEFEALDTVYRAARSEGRWCGLGSVKAQIGHTKAAAGAASVIKAALALHHKVLPATIKVGEPHPKMDLVGSPFYINTRTRPWMPADEHPRRAGVSSFGFGGSNFHVALEESGPAKVDVAWDGSVDIVALSGATRDELAATLDEWIAAIKGGQSDEQLAYRAAVTRREFSVAGECRLVVVVERGSDRAGILEEAREALGARGGESEWSLPGVYFGESRPAGELALLFPGQASQYVDMGGELVCVFPEAHEAIVEADATRVDGSRLSELIYPQPVFDQQESAAQRACLVRTEVAQPAIGAVSLGLLRVLERFGVRGGLMAGHSYGELVALRAAGRIDDAGLRRLSELRGRLMAAGEEDRGTMCAVAAPLDELSKLLDESDCDAVLANRNSPTQGVISGSRAGVEQAAEACRERGWSTTALHVSAAFHSRFMVEAQTRFREELDDVVFEPGSVPVFANVSAEEYPADAAAARDLLGRQLTAPVDFVAEVENLYAAGARVFVEVGPKKVLTGLVRATLGDRPHTAIALDASGGRGSGMVDLARALAQLAVLGQTVDLSQWEPDAVEPRRLKMAIPLCGTNYRVPRERKPARAERVKPRAVPLVSEEVKEVMSVNPSGSGRVKPMRDTRQVPSTAATNAGDSAMLEQVQQSVREGLRAMQVLQQQTASAHERFLENQSAAHKTIHTIMENQQRLVERALGLPGKPLPRCDVPAPVAPVVADPIVPATFEPSPPPADAQPVEDTLLQTISEKTGYSVDMIGLDMDLESDLGIDLVRRVEVLAALEQRLGSIPGLSPERTNGFRTPREILEFVTGNAPEPTRASEAAVEKPATAEAGTVEDVDGGDSAQILLEVVAEQTGYPVEMLELEMDLEADLGIDSIKRVSIMAAVEARLPGLERADSYMGSLRTLGNIVEYMSGAATTDDTVVETPAVADAAEAREVTKEHEPEEDSARRVLELVDLPAIEPEDVDLAAGHEIWVTDDGTGLAGALGDILSTQGIGCRVVKLGEPLPEESKRPVAGLIILAPPTVANDAVWDERAEILNKSAFALTKELGGRLRSAADEGGAILATVSRCDGGFGLIGGAFDPLQGGLAGLTKTAAHEWPSVRCRALDVSPDWTDIKAVAGAIAGELGVVEGPIEVGLDEGMRRGLELVSRSADVGELPIEPGDVIVVTGGARGVTAEAAVALAQAARPTLVLLGRSPEPEPEPDWLVRLEGEAEIKRALLDNAFNGDQPNPARLESEYRARAANRELLRNLERVREAGATAIYRSVDVRDGEAVAAILDAVRRDAGPIRGLIHGAGVLEDRLIEEKTAEQFERVFDTKVAGLRVLLDAIGADELRVLVLFSSVSGRYGRQGQVDYAMANEVLNKVAQRQQAERPNCRVVAINWGPWDGGMVTPELRREFGRQGIGLIPLEVGARCLLAELGAGGGGPVEVTIGGSFPRAEAAAKHAVIVVPTNGDLTVAFERKLDIDSHPFLRSHVIDGHPVLPMAMMAEWLGHAALHGNPGLMLHGLDDLRVLKGVVLSNGPRDMQVAASRARREGDYYAVDVELRTGSNGDEELLHARAKVLLADSRPRSPEFAVPAELDSRPYSRGIDGAYGEVLFHGPSLRGISRVRGMSAAGLVAELKSAPAPTEWMHEPLRSAWIGDPLVIDGALQLGILWGFEELGSVSLPNFGARYRQYREFPTGGVTSVLEVRESHPHQLIIDVTFLDGDGAVVARMEGYEWTVDGSLRRAFGHDVTVGV